MSQATIPPPPTRTKFRSPSRFSRHCEAVFEELVDYHHSRCLPDLIDTPEAWAAYWRADERIRLAIAANDDAGFLQAIGQFKTIAMKIIDVSSDEQAKRSAATSDDI
jgi:hypothetical protein